MYNLSGSYFQRSRNNMRFSLLYITGYKLFCACIKLVEWSVHNTIWSDVEKSKHTIKLKKYTCKI